MKYIIIKIFWTKD